MQNALKNRICSHVEHKPVARPSGFAALYQKELSDHFHSTRFKLLFGILILTSLASLFGAMESISDAAFSSSEFIFLSVFTATGNSIPSFASFLAYLAPLVGLTLGFDAINKERAQGTLGRLVSQPIHRDAVINAKFLSGVTIISLMILFIGGMISGLIIMLIGIPPSGEEIARVVSYLLFTIVYTALWLALSMLCSVLCRHTATSALIVISIWLFLTLFANMIVTIIADTVYPLEGIEGYFNMMSNYELQQNLNRISPYYLYCEAASTLLNPNVRTVGITTQASYSGAIASYLSFDQSVLLIWPHLTIMLALTMAAFTISYLCFMRQEIRS